MKFRFHYCFTISYFRSLVQAGTAIDLQFRVQAVHEIPDFHVQLVHEIKNALSGQLRRVLTQQSIRVFQQVFYGAAEDEGEAVQGATLGLADVVHALLVHLDGPQSYLGACGEGAHIVATDSIFRIRCRYPAMASAMITSRMRCERVSPRLFAFASDAFIIETGSRIETTFVGSSHNRGRPGDAT